MWYSVSTFEFQTKGGVLDNVIRMHDFAHQRKRFPRFVTRGSDRTTYEVGDYTFSLWATEPKGSVYVPAAVETRVEGQPVVFRLQDEVIATKRAVIARGIPEGLHGVVVGVIIPEPDRRITSSTGVLAVKFGNIRPAVFLGFDHVTLDLRMTLERMRPVTEL